MQGCVLFLGKKIISKVRTMATAKNNEANVIMLLVSRSWGTRRTEVYYLFFSLLYSVKSAKRKNKLRF